MTAITARTGDVQLRAAAGADDATTSSGEGAARSGPPVLGLAIAGGAAVGLGGVTALVAARRGASARGALGRGAFVAGLTMAAGLLAGCGGSQSSGTSSPGGTPYVPQVPRNAGGSAGSGSGGSTGGTLGGSTGSGTGGSTSSGTGGSAGSSGTEVGTAVVVTRDMQHVHAYLTSGTTVTARDVEGIEMRADFQSTGVGTGYWRVTHGAASRDFNTTNGVVAYLYGMGARAFTIEQ